MRPAALAALALGLVLGAQLARAQPTVYRCGQTYQDSPCPQGKPNPVIVSVVAQAAEEEVVAAPVVAAPAEKTKAKKTEKQNKK